MSQPCVYIVDDDESIRRALGFLLKAANIEVQSFSRTNDFLESYVPGSPGCLVLDVRMPGPGGLDLQQTLLERNIKIPIIFISGHGDVPTCSQALKAGAVDFFEKPFDADRMLASIRHAIELDSGSPENEAT